MDKNAESHKHALGRADERTEELNKVEGYVGMSVCGYMGQSEWNRRVAHTGGRIHTWAV